MNNWPKMKKGDAELRSTVRVWASFGLPCALPSRSCPNAVVSLFGVGINIFCDLEFTCVGKVYGSWL